MKIGCDWKRANGKDRIFNMTFDNAIQFKEFFENFLNKDNCNEVLSLRIWKEGESSKTEEETSSSSSLKPKGFRGN